MSVHDGMLLSAQETPSSEQDDILSSAEVIVPVSNRKSVMVIYGHDKEANTALFDWLRAIGLQPREWDHLVRASGNASPYIGDVLDQAFKDAQAVIAFFTPDERVRPRGHSGPWRLQARPNVLIEAGMALVTHQKHTILAVLGLQELPSDLAGRHYVRLNHAAPKSLNALANRLRDAGCDVDLSGTDWLDPTRFPNRDNLTPQPADPARPWPATPKSPANAQAASKSDSGSLLTLPPFDVKREIESGEYDNADLALCVRIQLDTGLRSFRYLTEDSRTRILNLLNGHDSLLTGRGSGAISLISGTTPESDSTSWTSVHTSWELDGPNSSRQLSANWQGSGQTRDSVSIEARVHAELAREEREQPGEQANLLRVNINLLLIGPSPSSQPRKPAVPFLNLGDLRSLMLDTIGSLWGSHSITWLLDDRPNEASVALDMTAFTVPDRYPFDYDWDGIFRYPRLDECIDFGHARLVPGNTPGKAAHFNAICYDNPTESPDSRSNVVRDWLMQLGIDNGFHNMIQEIERWK